MKILAVNIAFRNENFYKRWRLLASNYNLNVHLVGPKYYKYELIGKPLIFKPEAVNEESFKVSHIDMKKRIRNDWFSLKFLRLLIKFRPDIIYLLGLETQNAVFLSYFYKIFFNRKTKIGLFSMRGTKMPLNRFEFKWRWHYTKKIFDFINLHYPYGKEIFEQQAYYKGPIQLQTQIGVDKDVYFKSEERRQKIRDRHDINKDEFVFCSASRVDEIKGVFDIVTACKHMSNKKFRFFMLGDGKDYEKIKLEIEKHNLMDIIITPGMIENGIPVAEYLAASDCFVHVPHTTKKWVDTFPLAVVQAMATKLPVIGSDSGAVPYQLGDNGFIVCEKNVKDLVSKMSFVINNKAKSLSKGLKLYNRAMTCFEIRSLNNFLFQTFKAIYFNQPSKIIKDQIYLDE